MAVRLRSPATKDDDVNKAPGGAGGQGTRADGRARAPGHAGGLRVDRTDEVRGAGPYPLERRRG